MPAQPSLRPLYWCRRKLLPRSGASLTYVPPIDGDYDSDGDDGEGGAGGDGGGGGVRPASGKVYLFGGQDPVKGVIFDDMLVSMLCVLRALCGVGCRPCRMRAD